MVPHLLRVLTVLVLVAGFALPVQAQAQTSGCQFTLGFKTIHDAMPAIVGDCLENEHYNAIGDSVQQTAKGLLAWRKADNWTAFTDGYRTWINGPHGMVNRLNTQRFTWEGDYGSPGTSPVAGSRIVCKDGYVWPSLTRQGACSRHGGIAAGY